MQQFFYALDRCRVFINGRSNFPFGLELFLKKIKSFLATSPSFECLPVRLMTKVRMRMWGEMMPKRGRFEFLARITSDVLDMFSNDEDHALDMVPYPYVGMD